jgi:hypothetical protein
MMTADIGGFYFDWAGSRFGYRFYVADGFG